MNKSSPTTAIAVHFPILTHILKGGDGRVVKVSDSTQWSWVESYV